MGTFSKTFGACLAQQGAGLNLEFTSPGSFSVPENTTEVGTIIATPSGCTYSIVAGDDGANFSIDTNTGVLSFIYEPDYETPTDTGSNILRDENGYPVLDENNDPILTGDDVPDNVYYVKVRATLGFKVKDQYVVVNVNNVYDTLETETTSYISRMTTEPNTQYKIALDIFIKNGLKPVWNKIPALWISANHDLQASRLNVMKDAHNLTYVNDPTFQAGIGVNSNGSSSYANTNFNPFLHGGAARVLNNMAIILVCQTDSYTVSTYGDFGAFVFDGAAWKMDFMQLGDYYAGYLRGTVLSLGSGAEQHIATPSPKGITIAYVENGNLKIMHNGSIVYNQAYAQSNTQLLNANMYYLANNINGNASFSGSKVFSMAGVAGGLTTAECTALSNAINTYLTSLGCGLY